MIKGGQLDASSLNIDSIVYPRKTASGNPYKNLNAIQRSGQKLCPFRVDTQVWPTRLLPHGEAIP